ncbi:hypothetical protein JYU14_02650 [Simkania negevensis]|uniref:Lipoprotein n=1 Tax=Simkania negevensis TaxID=83561 RepID=A0ABS3AQF0_9BACT|nr:hypothetical protein [Simkania negevensis]
MFFNKKNLLFFCLVILCGCSSHTSFRDKYALAYQQGNFAEADQILTKKIDRELPQGNITKSGDATWLLLDRATVRFAMGSDKGSIDDYKQAIKALDFFRQALFSESIGKILLSDKVGAYPAENYEQLLARLYFALALIQNNDVNNGIALLKQAESLQQEYLQLYQKTAYMDGFSLEANPVAKYLLALYSEKNRDSSNAKILYRQVSQLIGSDNFDRFEVLTDPDLAALLLLGHNGNAPYKVSVKSPASQASALGLAFFLQGTDVGSGAFSALPGIPVPELMNWPAGSPIPLSASLDGITRHLVRWYNIDRVAREELKQARPIIIARGVARLLIRSGAVVMVGEKSRDLQDALTVAMFIANIATEADTRSWATLPYAIDLARFDLVPGEHILSVAGRQFSIALKEGEVCIVNLFALHPGVIVVRIPAKNRTSFHR